MEVADVLTFIHKGSKNIQSVKVVKNIFQNQIYFLLPLPHHNFFLNLNQVKYEESHSISVSRSLYATDNGAKFAFANAQE